MTGRWRTPGRRTIAAAATAAVLATGLTYLGLDGPEEQPERKDSATPKTERPPRPLSEGQAAARAARTGKPVEATAKRTAYSTTWARPDGLMHRRVHATPIRAKAGGEWKAIDTGLTRVKGGWSPRATNTGMVFSAGSAAGDDRASRATARRVSLLPGATTANVPGGNPLATLKVGTHEIVLTWPGTVPAPIIDGSRALYPEILPGADLVLTADDGGFAQLLVVKNRQAAADPRVAQLSYGISSPALDFALDPATGMLTAVDEGGTDIAHSPTPLMWDNSGTPALTDGQAGTDVPPTEPEVLPTDDPGPPDAPEEVPSPTPTDTLNDGDQEDVLEEALPQATDEAPDPSAIDDIAGSDPPVPPVPSPEPSQTGPAATLSLPNLNGPQPDTRGALVGTDLSGSTWVMTPDQEFLNDPETVYPVFIDPSVTKHTNDWTTAYSRHPRATFYNGKNFNKGGTHEARVGFESDTWGTSRSYFTIDWESDLKTATVVSAQLRALSNYSWSCSKRSMSVHLTGEVNSKTNWKNAPAMNNSNKIAGDSFAHGWKSTSCPRKYVKFDVKPTATKALRSGWSTLTLGFRAADEKSQYSWKKFQANGGNGPHVDLHYNRPPSAPTSLDLDPDLSCDTTAPYVNVGASSLTFWGSAADKDGNLSTVNFELWPTKGSTANLLGAKGKVSVGSQKTTARVHTDPFSTAGLRDGVTYSWRAKAVDKFGASSAYSHSKTPCRFVFDKSRPTPPRVSSVDFPDADTRDNGFGTDSEDGRWSERAFGTSGVFTFRANQTDVVKYEYGFNQASYTGSVTRTTGTPVTTERDVSLKPPLAGPNVLYVRAVDDAGHISEPRKYFFYTAPRHKADAPGDFTGDELPDLMVVDGNGNLRLYPSEHTPDLTKGTGDLDYSMAGAYRANPERDPHGGDGEPEHAAPPSGYWKGTLITHLGDVYGGDGLQDLVARRDGKLWVYPGDGYGGVNTDKRQEIILPANAPDPDTITQLVAAGDATGDGKTDFFLTVGDAIWALIGYNGATVEEAVRLSSSPWANRDIVSVQDITGDKVADLVYRSGDSGRLLLRTGKKDPAGSGVELKSLSAAIYSAKGEDTYYSGLGWGTDSIRIVYGAPDLNGDDIPDIWTLRTDGAVRVYMGARDVLTGTGTEVVGNSSGGWKHKLTIG
ncbi:DNRLRE domain-containing protein [Streptomyces yaizuensis]|uniref:DNRLRE domain-containing protein n=1 Tax=Streptomyces yaizuensis TaxID=2989713 RepID=A0ABQ5NTE7_9ACTN|nr:DNRLRE domain-containing protein [Streptomyces sp. YSPA8]GLF93440.1 DNRLRE domain-containing protein [Streptomyces sp. YSPA8]